MEGPGLGGQRAAPSPALAARGISKRFANVRALDGVSIVLAAGEVHGLLGQNGSGKSTLVKVLAGYHAPDPGGQLDVGERPVGLPLQPGQAAALGLSFVHQDLGLIPSLSVVENLRLQELASSRRLFISWRSERRRARATLARLGIDVDPAAPVAGLQPVDRARVAIARALEGLAASGASRVLVLDEATAYLPRNERRDLVALIREVAAAGAGVLFVSHDLDEALAVADRITVLRDGRNAGTLDTAGADAEVLVRLIVGHELEPLGAPGRAPAGGGAAVVSVDGLSGANVRGLSFTLDEGEVVGLTGLLGSGFEEVPYLLYGAGHARGGELTLGRTYDLTAMTPHRALRAGMALLPGDRLHDGGVAALSLEANVTLPVLHRYALRGRLDRGRMRRDAETLLAGQGVQPADPLVALGALSGGNQQKALLAKWIGVRPRMLLLEEPTRGVDVGARARIDATIRGLARDGVAVLCASTDHDELGRLCDRVLVFGGGEVASQIAREEVTAARIAERCQTAGRPAPGGHR